MLAQRFWNKVEKTDSCWLWTAALTHDGYGRFVVPLKNGAWQTRLSHRVVYESLVGPIGGKLVLHRCDVRNCVNPDHLFLGTNKDNTTDMIAKGRGVFTGARGEAAGNAKLTEPQIREIRARWDAGERAKKLKKSFPMVRDEYFWQIGNRRRWAHVLD